MLELSIAVTTGLWLRRRACDCGGLPGVELNDTSPRDAERERVVDVIVDKASVGL